MDIARDIFLYVFFLNLFERRESTTNERLHDDFTSKNRYQRTEDIVSSKEKKTIQQQILNTIKERDMAPMYVTLTKMFGWKLDEKLHAELKAKNEKKLKELDEKYKDAEKNQGEYEVLTAATEKANYLSSIGDKAAMQKAFELVKEKAFSSGQKIDASFNVMRNAFMHDDLDLMKKALEDSKQLVEEGGDWDRRNRRRVYEGVYKLNATCLPPRSSFSVLSQRLHVSNSSLTRI